MKNRCEQVIHSRWEGRQGGSGVGITRGSPGGPRRRSSVEVPMGSYGQGSIRAASRTTLGVLRTWKMKGNERFYGFTDYRGPAARRGRDRRASKNQVTAGSLSHQSLHRFITSRDFSRGLGHLPIVCSRYGRRDARCHGCRCCALFAGSAVS